MPLQLNIDLTEERPRVPEIVAFAMDKPAAKTDVLTLIPKRNRSAVSMRADETDNWGQEELDEKEAYTLTLRDPSIKNELLDRLNTFRRNRELCDAVLFVKEREIFVHKVVLAAVSPALLDMFNADDENQDENSASTSPTNGYANGVTNGNGTTPATNGTANKTQKSSMTFFEFSQTDFDCFEALVNFAYTANLEISSRKVAELYKTAYALQMNPVIKACAAYLADNLQLSNCIGVRRQANFHNDTFLMCKVDQYIVDNFESVVNDSKEFTQLPVIQVRIIVPAEDGKVANNANNNGGLAEMALLYFQNMPHDRAEHSIDLLTCKTHILYMEENHLADCLEMDERSSVGSCDIIQDYKKSGKDRKDVAKAMTAQEPIINSVVQHRVNGAVPVRLNASRLPNLNASNESLESAGTDDSDPQDTIEWLLIATHRTAPQYWVALCVLYRRLCVLSLQLTDNEELLRTKREPCPMDAQKVALLSRLISCTGKQQKPLECMSASRCSIGASFVNGKIFVCGGYDRGECMKSVEEYDVISGKWRNVANMKAERGRFDCTVHGGKVYAVAGSNGNNDLKSCELYDPKTNTWAPLPNLNTARCHNGCATMDDYVYCIGGSFDQKVLKDCERFDTKTQEWTIMAPMESARYQAGVCSWRGLIVAVGGCDRWACMDSVEAYDPKTKAWRQLPKLRQARRGCAVAVMRDVLYVIGGHDGTQSLDTVEILDSPSSQWRVGPTLTTARANTHAVVTAGNVIYCIGGFNGNKFLDSIELLENEQIGWRNWQHCPEYILEEQEEEDSQHVVDDVISSLASSPSL
uniref:BTB domain-containing protein n=1 Tax=Caenorhabditis japonica TaxID=281687 RepID=A0A8R1HTB7_CAEJA